MSSTLRLHWGYALARTHGDSTPSQGRWHSHHAGWYTICTTTRPQIDLEDCHKRERGR
jgi:hypothetical protein